MKNVCAVVAALVALQLCAAMLATVRGTPRTNCKRPTALATFATNGVSAVALAMSEISLRLSWEMFPSTKS